MGTNFYLRGHGGEIDPQYHIGKRSAAGAYCWDCKVTLCKNGEEAIHYGARNDFHDACPRCGKKPTPEGYASAGARELGFNSIPPARKTGVASCSSFTWAMDPTALLERRIAIPDKCHTCDRPFPPDHKVIEDEYGRLYSMEEFKQVLEECPVQYSDSIGQHFS